jgi:CRP/FNR family transcriptional regulator, cyclic AMP receptor protein
LRPRKLESYPKSFPFAISMSSTSPVLLPRTGILSYMDDESREHLASYGRVQSTGVGQVVIQDGEVNYHLYIVLSGTFRVTTCVKGSEVILDEVGAGDCLGEVAIFHPDKASATVTSVGPGKLWSMDADAMQAFLDEWPSCGCAALLGINIILSRRLRRADDVIRANKIVPGFLSVRAQKRYETAKLPKGLK